MLEKLRIKMGHWIIRKKFLKPIGSPLNFNQEIKNSKNYLLILPQTEDEIYHALIIADYLLTKDKSITFFLPYKFRNSVDKYDNSTVISFHEQSKTKLYLPNKNFRNKFSQMNFDIVIDFNRNEDLFMSSLSNIVKSKIRIGFKKSNSDLYYNLLIENTSNEPQTCFNNLLNTLKMF